MGGGRACYSLDRAVVQPPAEKHPQAGNAPNFVAPAKQVIEIAGIFSAHRAHHKATLGVETAPALLAGEGGFGGCLSSAMRASK